MLQRNEPNMYGDIPAFSKLHNRSRPLEFCKKCF